MSTMHTLKKYLDSAHHKNKQAEGLNKGVSQHKSTVFYDDLTAPRADGKISLFDLLLTDKYKTVADDKLLYVDIADPDKKITYGQFKESVLKCAASLKREYGLQHGDVIATCSPDTIQYPILFFGALAAGCIFSPMRHSAISTAEDIIYDLHTLQPKLLILHPTELDTLYTAARDLSIPESNILTLDGRSKDPAYANVRTVDEVLLSSDELAEPYPYTQEDIVNSPCFLLFTSGSTGRRKAVILSQNQIVHYMLNTTYKIDSSFKYVTVTSHSFLSSLFFCVLNPVFFGTLVYFLDKDQRSLENICRAVDQYKISTLFMPPYMLYSLAKDAEISQTYNISSLQTVLVGGSTVEKSMLTLAKEKTGVNFTNLYAMTECLGIVSNDPEGSIDGSLGRIRYSNSARIVDLDGNDLPFGKVGELRIKGPTMTLGYYKNPEATAELFDDQGYLRTGDMCRMYENGTLYYVNRLKDLIKHKMFYFYPVDVEKVLITHPNVFDCAVVGIDSKEHGTEVARAFVTLLDRTCDKDKALKEIREYTEAQLPESKHLYGGIYEVESFPRTESGKIQKLQLKQIILE